MMTGLATGYPDSTGIDRPEWMVGRKMPDRGPGRGRIGGETIRYAIGITLFGLLARPPFVAAVPFDLALSGADSRH